MSGITYKQSKIPSKDIVLCWTQASILSALRLVLIVLGLFLVPLVIKRSVVLVGTAQHHNQKYVEKGSSGMWVRRILPPDYSDMSGNKVFAVCRKFLWLFDNDVDGSLGDSRGEWSAKRKGSEDSWLSQYLWLAVRNPVNNLRQTKLFSCAPDQCAAVCYGKDLVLDNKPVTDEGRWFIKATDKTSGRVYYSFRKVVKMKLCNLNISIGFKLKPDHWENGVDDGTKGFTRRITPYKD